MPRPKSLKPKYCRHPSGRAYIRIDGHFVYLGDHGTQASRDEYDRVIGEWIANHRVSAKPSQPDSPTSVTVSTVIAAFWRHAQTYYVDPTGKQSPELDNFRLALRPLRRLYGATPAAEFGPLALKSIRSTMIKPSVERDEKIGREIHREGWSRNYCNRQIARVRQVFKWAVAEQMLPATVHQGLTAVDALKRGRSEARETDPVRPVPLAYVEATRPFLSREIGAMIDLQILSGARSGELCVMRTCDIDRSGNVWLYKPEKHKTSHHGHERIIRFGRRAQAILEEFLKPNLAAFVFSPADAEAERREQQASERQTPLTPSQIRRAELAATRERQRAPGQRYDSRSYCRAIARACDRANEWAKAGRVIGNDDRLIPSWHPHQLRHNFATAIRRDFGADAALTLLGDKTTRMIDVYAEKDGAKASEIIERVG